MANSTQELPSAELWASHNKMVMEPLDTNDPEVRAPSWLLPSCFTHPPASHGDTDLVEPGMWQGPRLSCWKPSTLCALSVSGWDQLHQEGIVSPFSSTFPGPSPSPVSVVEHPHLRAEPAWVKPFLSSPKGAQHHQEGEAAAEVGAGVNCIGELCQPSSPGGPGILHEQQIL